MSVSRVDEKANIWLSVKPVSPENQGQHNQGNQIKIKIKIKIKKKKWNKFKAWELMNGDEMNRKESGVVIYSGYSNKQYLNIK